MLVIRLLGSFQCTMEKMKLMKVIYMMLCYVYLSARRLFRPNLEPGIKNKIHNAAVSFYSRETSDAYAN